MRYVLLIVLLSGCAASQLSKPPVNVLEPIAVSPDAQCKDQYAERVTIPGEDGTFFLECWGGTTT